MNTAAEETKSLTIDELCKLDTTGKLLALYQECCKKRTDPNFCKMQLWYGLPRARGEVGIKFFLCRDVFQYPDPVIRKIMNDNYDRIYQTLFNAVPPCNHNIEDGCGHDYPVPPETTREGWYSLSRDLNFPCECCGVKHPPGFSSILQQLKHWAGGPAPEVLNEDGWHTPDGKVINDMKEPVYVVRSREEGRALSWDLHHLQRWSEGQLSRWYVENAFYVVDAQAREALLNKDLTKTTVTGALGWKPVVMLYNDPEVFDKLQQICMQVAVVLPVKDRDLLAEVHNAIVEIKVITALATEDLPDECLDGFLGEIVRTRMKDFPRAYAWPAVLTAASVLVTKTLLPIGIRANLFTGLIGPVASGKTCCFNEAFRLLTLKDHSLAPVADTELIRLKAGSGEGLAQKIGDQSGESKLVFVDELEHLLKKLNIKGATFANTLDDAYCGDENVMMVEHRKEIAFHARLSIAGGIPEEGFAEAFGAGTVTGLHSRFMFGVCPSDYAGYCWHPPEGGPALNREYIPENELEFTTHRPGRITIDPSVWTEKTRWQRELKLDGRAIEIGIKAAIIAAAFDNRGTLTGDQLGPALAFAKYQHMIHRKFLPNPGKNPDAEFGIAVVRYLEEHAPDGEWINRRGMLRALHANRYGAPVISRVLGALQLNGDIELKRNGHQLLIRLVVVL